MSVECVLLSFQAQPGPFRTDHRDEGAQSPLTNAVRGTCWVWQDYQASVNKPAPGRQQNIRPWEAGHPQQSNPKHAHAALLTGTEQRFDETERGLPDGLRRRRPGFSRHRPCKGHVHCGGSFWPCPAHRGRDSISPEKGKMLREQEGLLALGQQGPRAAGQLRALPSGSDSCLSRITVRRGRDVLAPTPTPRG